MGRCRALHGEESPDVVGLEVMAQLVEEEAVRLWLHWCQRCAEGEQLGVRLVGRLVERGRSKFSRPASLASAVRPFELELDTTRSLRSGTKTSGAPTANTGSLDATLPLTAERLLIKRMMDGGVGKEVHLSLTTTFMRSNLQGLKMISSFYLLKLNFN
jgi:hypothetical protein